MKIEEQFKIISIKNNIAELEPVKQEGCTNCSTGCGLGILGRYFAQYKIKHRVDTNKKVGDIISLSIDNKTLFLNAFLMYLLPLIALFLGGGLGHLLNPDNEILQIILAFVCLFISLAILRFLKVK